MGILGYLWLNLHFVLMWFVASVKKLNIRRFDGYFCIDEVIPKYLIPFIKMHLCLFCVQAPLEFLRNAENVLRTKKISANLSVKYCGDAFCSETLLCCDSKPSVI